jgi:hypothetical protein
MGTAGHEVAALGTFAAGAKHRYRFTVALNGSVGDAYQGDSSSVQFDFDAAEMLGRLASAGLMMLAAPAALLLLVPAVLGWPTAPARRAWASWRRPSISSSAPTSSRRAPTSTPRWR